MTKRAREDSISSEDSRSTTYTPSSISNLSSRENSIHPPKYAQLDTFDATMEPRNMSCFLSGHKPVSFATYASYEVHYNRSHTHRCTECHKNFPDAHFLELHIAENHDPIVAARKAKGEKVYACFVKACDKTCSDWKKRRSHLVDKHGIPKNYDFLIVDGGTDGRSSMLRAGVDAQGHRRSSRERRGSDTTDSNEATLEAEAMEAEAGGFSKWTDTQREVDDVEVSNGHDKANPMIARMRPQMKSPRAETSVDDITSSMSALKMIPRSVTFGKRKGRAGFAKS